MGPTNIYLHPLPIYKLLSPSRSSLLSLETATIIPLSYLLYRSNIHYHLWHLLTTFGSCQKLNLNLKSKFRFIFCLFINFFYQTFRVSVFAFLYEFVCFFEPHFDVFFFSVVHFGNEILFVVFFINIVPSKTIICSWKQNKKRKRVNNKKWKIV